jgi:flagellar basal-body rod protein FlgB
MLINTSSIDLIGRALEASNLRQEVIANNIANSDVPGFKRSYVRFEDVLREQLAERSSTFTGVRTDPRHLYIGKRSSALSVRPEIVQDKVTVMNNNGNNVDLDYEMSLMAKNQIYYNTLVQMVNGKFKKIRTAIDGRA